MADKIHIKSDKSNAQLLRDLQKECQLPDTNKKIQQFMLDVYGRNISIQQIASVLARYCDRPILMNKKIDDLARQFLLSCKNDVGLCRRILKRYEDLPCII